MLKSCPMCDSENILVKINLKTEVCFVECSGCGTRTGDYIFEKEANETWNMRLREDKVWKRIEKFRESLKLKNQYDPALRG